MPAARSIRVQVLPPLPVPVQVQAVAEPVNQLQPPWIHPVPEPGQLEDGDGVGLSVDPQRVDLQQADRPPPPQAARPAPGRDGPSCLIDIPELSSQ